MELVDIAPATRFTGGLAGIEIPDNNVNDAWRDGIFHLIPFDAWAANFTRDRNCRILRAKNITVDCMPISGFSTSQYSPNAMDDY